MQTVLVNPYRATKQARTAFGRFAKSQSAKGKRRGGKTRVSMMRVVQHPVVVRANGKRRRARKAVVIRLRSNPGPTIHYANPRRRHRRRAANMMILPNRSHRRRSLANPFSFRATIQSVTAGAVGAAGTYLLNKYGISRIQASDETDATLSVKGIAMRGAVRTLIGAAAAIFFPGAIGGAANGAMYYPLFREIDAYMAQTAVASTGADLQGLEADLHDVLDDY